MVRSNRNAIVSTLLLNKYFLLLRLPCYQFFSLYIVGLLSTIYFHSVLLTNKIQTHSSTPIFRMDDIKMIRRYKNLLITDHTFKSRWTFLINCIQEKVIPTSISIVLHPSQHIFLDYIRLYLETSIGDFKFFEVHMLYIDLRPRQTCHSKDGGSAYSIGVGELCWQYGTGLKSYGTATNWCTGREWHVNCMTVISAHWRSNMPFQRRRKWHIPMASYGEILSRRLTCELHDSYFCSMTIKHAIPKTAEVTHSDGQIWGDIEWAIELLYNSVKTGSQLVWRSESFWRPDQFGNQTSWRQDMVEKASTQQRAGHPASGWATLKNGKETVMANIVGVNMLLICSVSNSLSHTKLSNKVRGIFF